MKYRFLIFLLLAGSVAFAQRIPSRPSPPRLVNDYVGLLTQDQRDHLEQKLVAYDDSTSVQIAVVIVNTLDDYDPVDYAVKLGREWGVGNKKTNNGVILLISTEEGKRKVFIAPGYGLEGALPDITCKQIVDNELVPELKRGNYFRGISDAADAIIQASRGEYKAPEGYRSRGNNAAKGGGALAFFIIVIVVIVILSRGGGGRGGGMMSRRGYRGMDILPLLFLGGGGGGRSSGGGWSGGGGGGFGGFGGGSFGGGGSGGSW